MSETLPTTMRAAVLRDPNIGLQVEEIPVPQPKAGEVLLKVSGCGLCHSDLHVLGGKIAFPLPAVLGHEVAGEIAALGPGTQDLGLRVGMRVSAAFLMPCGNCPACNRGRDDLCERFFGMNRLRGVLYDGTSRLSDAHGAGIFQYSMGGLAEYAVTPATSVAAMPEDMDPVASAILGCAAFTAYGAVRRGAELRFGETCAVVAVGGVGANIVQIARAMGAKQVIAIDVSDEKLAPALDLGATHTINSLKVDAAAAVAEITDGVGVDVAFEALGIPATWTTALSVLRDGGRVVPIGLGSGNAAAAVPINQMVRRSQQIIGSYGARTREDLPHVVRMAHAGLIDFENVVTRRIPLEAAQATYRELADGAIQGRAVVDMSM
jgi:S-(hydroxymethyl)glutathione dehydrogenase/alcohol dehydrogenase